MTKAQDQRSQSMKEQAYNVLKDVCFGEEAWGDDIWRIICEELDDTWAWVALGPERQQVATVGAPKAPQPPPAAGPARTMTHRIARLEEDFHRMRGALGEQREVLDSMACDFSRFTTWMVTELSMMMDQAGVRYTNYADFQISYQRRVKRRTDDASTLGPQQPDP
ncbi:hypothetical protein Tco_0601779 [Tanacetum coccineum]